MRSTHTKSLCRNCQTESVRARCLSLFSLSFVAPHVSQCCWCNFSMSFLFALCAALLSKPAEKFVDGFEKEYTYVENKTSDERYTSDYTCVPARVNATTGFLHDLCLVLRSLLRVFPLYRLTLRLSPCIVLQCSLTMRRRIATRTCCPSRARA